MEPQKRGVLKRGSNEGNEIAAKAAAERAAKGMSSSVSHASPQGSSQSYTAKLQQQGP